MIKNFWDKKNTNWFAKNKENINKKWAPRKLFSTVNIELKWKWIEPLSKEQLIEAYSLIFNTDEEELKRIKDDKTYPFALRLIIKELDSDYNRMKAMQDYRDYMFWKAVQKEEIKYTWDININKFCQMDDDELNSIIEQK